ncbi:MAG: hypothetical protein HQM13_00370 [SAR324 cluster bacterium]|nr:hypothetical protein [SAR324 cluster bacterium]
MHDIVDLENRGIPGVFIASSEFESAVTSQSAALGYDPAVVFVPHPIQDRTDEEIREIAENAVKPLLAALAA